MASAKKIMQVLLLLAPLVGVAACMSTLPMQADRAHAAPPGAAFGKPVSEQDVASWNIDIMTKDGTGLPPGKGDAVVGRTVYEQYCIACHGEQAKGGPVFGSMVGGIGSFKTNTRVLTPGSMYPYAPILFDYIRRAMPMNAPQSLSNDQVYAVSAYILHLNGLVGETDQINARTMPAVMMPNRNGFIVDDRPDTSAVRCMSNCK